MPNRKISFANGSYYHVYNRGVDKRVIFETAKDFRRFLKCIQLFNSPKNIWLAEVAEKLEVKPQEQLVDVICYCLMPNHFHLLLKQRVENGIPLFMQKVGTGYTMYFNTRKERSGRLFQGTYKAKVVGDNDYLTHLSRYIHLNPIELVEHDWGKLGIKNRKRAFDFLYNYCWSSYPGYLSGINGEIISKNILYEIFTPESYKKFVESWVTKDTERIAL